MISGKIGDIVKVTGESFFTVTKVNLLTADCQFEVLNNNLMNVTIPSGGTTISPIFSSDYTNSLFTGVDVLNVFPQTLELNKYTGMYLDTLTVSGNYFSGVTGVRLNNIQCPFSVVSNNRIDLTIPSGNVRGLVKLQTANGLEHSSSFKFFPEVSLTGFNLSSAGTGQSLLLLGQYFFPELLLLSGTKFLVSFNGNQATGFFSRLDNFTLSGAIPTGAISGDIKIAKSPESAGLIEYYSS